MPEPDLESTLSALTSNLGRILPHFDHPQPLLARSYAPGKWSMRQILTHLSDTESVLLDRLRRLAAEAEPTLTPFDENRWAQHLFYDRRDLKLARTQFETARLCSIELVRIAWPQAQARTGLHPERGQLSFAQVAAHPAKHAEHHLQQIQAIVEGKTWTPQ